MYKHINILNYKVLHTTASHKTFYTTKRYELLHYRIMRHTFFILSRKKLEIENGLRV